MDADPERRPLGDAERSIGTGYRYEHELAENRAGA